ncbi:MAG: serine/threonine protein kinase [Polyangiaceae bacterium]|nr:serine/threonine protein kinase [Polyangiaceae bacterium]
MTDRATDVRRKTVAYVSPGSMQSGQTLPIPTRVAADTVAMQTLPAGMSLGATQQSASRKALAALLGETELAPSTTLPMSGAAISVSPNSSGPRVTVLPRVEMFGAEPRVVSEARERYVSEKKLGEGGLGEVMGARDQDIGRRVAVKRLRQEVKSDATLLRFAEEIRTIGKLEHPNIVPVHDVGIDEQGDHYFVMKYVDGETLETVIERLIARDPAYVAKYTIERRVEIFMALCEAVAFAHAQGILHRDIKPANVMVGAYGEVILMDWGVAKIKGSCEPVLAGPNAGPPSLSASGFSTVAGSIVGTPMYMSPEQSKGQPVDDRCDVYSLSLLFYELLTLTHPLEKKESLEAVLEGISNDPLPSVVAICGSGPDPVPAELGHFVHRGLAKDPAERFQSVTAMLDRLRARATGDIPIECPITFMKSMTGRWTRFVDRHPGGAVTLASVGVVGFLASIVTSVILAVG